MKKQKCYADLTAHPKIFSKTYWGGSRCDNLPDESIVSNRNAFVAEYAVTAFAGGGTPLSGDVMFDHPELYKCKSGYVYIASPYVSDDRLDAQAMRNGFKNYKKLYALTAKTYIRHFSDKYEFNRWIKAH